MALIKNTKHMFNDWAHSEKYVFIDFQLIYPPACRQASDP